MNSQEKQFSVVGLGASAGGLESVKQFFKYLPEDTGLAYVIVFHLDPTQESHLSQIISNYTKMSVIFTNQVNELIPNHVYIIPPGKIASISNNSTSTSIRLLTKDLPQKRSGVPTAIDTFFKSLAAQLGHSAVGVIFSGTGSDGTEGVQHINESGGICFAEYSESVKYPDMPNSAIASGCIDFALSAKKIAQQMPKLAAYVLDTEIENLSESNEKHIKQIFIMLKNKYLIDFSQYKSPTIQRRLQRRIALKKIGSVKNYIKYLNTHPKELDALFNDMLIKVTKFFRDKKSYNDLCKNILPKMLKATPPGGSIRVWVSGCSTGEEAYSIAICIKELIEESSLDVDFKIFATDVNKKSIEKARKGIYEKNISEHISSERLSRFFSETENNYKVIKQIRDLCVFAVHNLLKDLPFSQMDLISCRNVMIYFSKPTQEKLISIFHYALKPNGHLWLGDAESINKFDKLFKIAEKEAKIYIKNESKTPMPLAMFNSQNTSQTSLDLSPQSNIADRDKFIRQAKAFELNVLGPVGWVVDDHEQIIHIIGDTSSYILPNVGPPSFNLFKVARQELHISIRAGMAEAKNTSISVTRDNIKMIFNDRPQNLRLQVHPLQQDTSNTLYFLITITKTPAVLANPNKTINGKKMKGSLSSLKIENQHLHQELKDLQEHMKQINDQQELNNEALRVSNEEILFKNEELRSTNEEFQTTKEEVQSSNEELSTLNEELQARNKDLSLLSDDLNNFIDSTHTPIIMVDTSLRIRHFTPTAKTLFNLIPTDQARPLNDLSLNFDFYNLNKLILKVVESSQILEQDIKDHNNQWHIMRIQPYKNGEGKIKGAVISFNNITARKQLENNKNKSRIFFKNIVASVRQPLLILDSSFKIKLANQSFLDTFKVTKHETEGFKLWEIGDGQWNIPSLTTLLEQLLTEKDTFEDYAVDHEFKTIGRKIIHLNARKLKIDGDNDYDYDYDDDELILLAIEDVTKVTQQKIELEFREQRFRSIFENSPLAIIIMTQDNHIAKFNQAFYKLFGYSEEDLSGLSFADIIFKEDRTKSKNIIEKLLRGGTKKHVIQNRYIKKNDNIIWCDLTLAMIKEENSKVAYGIGILEDITLKKEVEKQNTSAQLHAQETSQAKSDFLSIVSHEIRTPLSTIIGFSELLIDPNCNPDDVHKFSQSIQSNSIFLKNLIEDVLDLSKIEAGKITVDKSKCQITHLLTEVMDVLEPQFKSKNVKFNLNFNGNVPKVIYSDIFRLRQVLTNIIGNSIKFTEQGKISVTVSLLSNSETSKNELVAFSVKDTGIGISKKQQKSLFQPFVQADSSITRRFGGSGLGLMLSKRIANALGGDVKLIISIPGEGSEFMITINSGHLSNTDQLETLALDELKKDKLITKKIIQQTLSGMNILVAEDTKELQFLMKQYLQVIGGAEVDLAENGKIAVKMAARKNYDLIIMDTMMPIMDGYEATERIKKLGLNTPIIALSARTMESEIEKGMSAGCEEYLVKPISVKKLLEVVYKYKKII